MMLWPLSSFNTLPQGISLLFVFINPVRHDLTKTWKLSVIPQRSVCFVSQHIPYLLKGIRESLVAVKVVVNDICGKHRNTFQPSFVKQPKHKPVIIHYSLYYYSFYAHGSSPAVTIPFVWPMMYLSGDTQKSLVPWKKKKKGQNMWGSWTIKRRNASHKESFRAGMNRWVKFLATRLTFCLFDTKRGTKTFFFDRNPWLFCHSQPLSLHGRVLTRSSP